MLELVCKELGVEIGEEWVGTDGVTYILEKEGIIEWYEPETYNSTDYDGWIMSGYEKYADLLTGKLRPIPKPQVGDRYYIPNISIKSCDRYIRTTWLDDEIDNWYLSNNLVFETKEEAIEATNKMINVLNNL